MTWSSLVTGRGGECSTGTGGDPGPRGTFLCRNFGGSSGSSGMFCIWMIRWSAPELCCRPCCDGVYLIYCGAPGRVPAARFLGCIALSLLSTMAWRAVMVDSLVASTISCVGCAIACTHPNQLAHTVQHARAGLRVIHSTVDEIDSRVTELRRHPAISSDSCNIHK